MSDTPAAASPHVATLGEHTEELLAEIGYSGAQVAGGVRLAKSEPRA
jgi:crotonobetainyl-CoA:carnitine CoA-transferase CaiB-like acyl-CoA transferase